MTELQRYLAEEVAEDHADGIIDRREALRRLSLLGLGMTTAASLLGAFAKRAGAAMHSPPTAADVAHTVAAGVPTRPISFRGPQGRKLLAVWAPAKQPRGGVLVIHENRGLTDHIRSVAGRFAASGYSALAIDLLSEEGGTGSFDDEAEAMAALYNVPTSRFVADLKAAVTELRRRLPGKKVAVTGFCFGGGMTWTLLTSNEPRVAAAAPFYGPFPEGARFTNSKAAVLGIYAGLDDRVNASRESARAALKSAGLKHQIVTYPGVDHAFFNDTGARYNAATAAQAYKLVLAWFGRHLAT
jgi:carboxymethylenebutenolidase